MSRPTSSDPAPAEAPEEASVDTLPPMADAPDVLDGSEAGRQRAAIRSALFGETDALAATRTLGRYRLVRRLGAGAHGVVWLAHDEELDRPVALKLVHPRAQALDDVDRARLRREARALAQLAHPNVAAVYEVGEDRGTVFVAMEHVAGRSLRAWMQARPRWREVVRVLVAAGRGLAAAHRQGLVHRDFKPDNVMLGDDGRVRVLDFGLARVVSARDETPRADLVGVAPTDARLTAESAISGTPAYMAPEQFAGASVDARTDQFAFCVTLYEVLHHVRPFDGNSLAELAIAVTEGAIAPDPAGRAPAWLRAAIVRGLAVEPARRWPDMDTLLAALERGAARRRTVVVASGVVASAVACALLWPPAEPDRDCGDASEQAHALWGAHERELEATFASGAPHLRATWDEIAPKLRTRAGAWAEAWARTCRDGGAKPSRAIDLRARCLERDRAEIASIVEVLRSGERVALDRAGSLVDGLPPLARCEDDVALAAPAAPAAEIADAVEALRARLAAGTTESRAGRNERALAVADDVLAEAERLGYSALLHETQVLQGEALEQLSRFEDAAAAFERAYDSGVAAGDDRGAGWAATHLAVVRGYHQSRFDDGLRWARVAQTHVERLPGPGRLAGDVLVDRGLVQQGRGDLDAARRDYEASIAEYERLGDQDDAIATVLLNLAYVAHARGDSERAAELLLRAVSLRRRVLGDAHPSLVPMLGNLALVRLDQQRLDDAETLLVEAIEIERAANGPTSIGLVSPLIHRGNLAERRRDGERALADYHEALALLEGEPVPDARTIAIVLGNIASVHVRLGELDRGIELLLRAHTSAETALGHDHPQLVVNLLNLGDALTEQGRFEQAERYIVRALELARAHHGPRHLYTGHSLALLGEIERMRGRHDHARARLEEALAILAEAEAPASEVASTRFALARVLDDRARAHELARMAHEAYLAAGPGFESDAAEVARWLAADRNRAREGALESPR